MKQHQSRILAAIADPCCAGCPPQHAAAEWCLPSSGVSTCGDIHQKHETVTYGGGDKLLYVFVQNCLQTPVDYTAQLHLLTTHTCRFAVFKIASDFLFFAGRAGTNFTRDCGDATAFPGGVGEN